MSNTRADRGARGRFGEIILILARHNLARGLSPEKLRAILEELGPTYVKLGQMISTRSDLMPEPYCRELSKLRTNAAPMPVETVQAVVEGEFAKPWNEVFQSLDPVPLGAASIAQAHLATLPDGRRVVAKVQRPGIYDIMRRDIALLQKAAALARFTPLHETVDFRMVLDEMWAAAQRELNFVEEAENLREFARNMREIRYAACPQVIDELVTRHILVLEYIDGIQIDDVPSLAADGYDPAEIASKLAANFIKQIVDDRFFHADPHAGNIRVRDGKILWLDLGMMGRLTDADGAMFTRYIQAVADNDIEAVVDAVLALGIYAEHPDRARLTGDIEMLLTRYRQMSLSTINIGLVMQEFLMVARRHGISMPPNYTMLARSVVILESVLNSLDPNTNLLKILSAHVKSDLFSKENARAYLEKHLRQFARSADTLSAIPGQLSDTLSKLQSGRATIQVNIAGSEQESRARDARSGRLALAIVAAALIVGGAISSLSSLPGPGGLPWPSAVLLGAASVALIALAARSRRR